MNALEKIFTSIKSAPSKGLKIYNTKELIRQLREYECYTLYILKNIYQLLTSESTLNRTCGAIILNKMGIFEYSMNFEMKIKTTNYVYLQYKDIKDIDGSGKKNKLDQEKQKKEIKKTLALDHVDANFLDAIELTEDNMKLNLKTAEYKEKNIENIYDFFEAVRLIMLSPDWYKRHGAFLASSAMIANALGKHFEVFEDEESLEIPKNQQATTYKIKLEGDLFNTIFEILKNDKFNDFQDDVTASPVRESASLLLKYVYPLLNNEIILLEISNLLTSEDWQEQFSGLIALNHLKEHFNAELVNLKIFNEQTQNLIDLLIGLIDSDDEDIKFISADLLSNIINRFGLEEDGKKIIEIKNKCWEQIDNEIDIAHSKASLIILLKTLYQKFSLDPPENINPLYPCFTSFNSLIRNSVLELSKTFSGCEFLYLLGETILLQHETNENGNSIVEILESKIALENLENLNDFAKHFLKLISQDSHLPYKEDDFGCYDEAFFTRDGIKSIGDIHNLNNKMTLFKLLLNIRNVQFENSDSDNLLRRCLGQLNILHNNLSNSEQNIKRTKINPKTLNEYCLENISEDFTQINCLKKMPIKEFKTIINDPYHLSLYPLCNYRCLEYVRKVLLFNVTNIVDFSLYFKLENSKEFLNVISNTIIFSNESNSDHLNEIVENLWMLLISLNREREYIMISRKNIEIFIKPKKKKEEQEDTKSHKEIIVEQGIYNISRFFEILNLKLFSLNTLKKLMQNCDRLIFFEHTISFYASCIDPSEREGIEMENLLIIFEEALERKNSRILKEYIRNIYFNSLFVKYLLNNFDSSLLGSLLDYSDPSFNVLFIKPMLKVFQQSGTTFSKLISSINLSPSTQIKDEQLLSLIKKEKEDIGMIINPSLIKDYDIVVKSKIQLRDYQKEGIKWLSFLCKFNLNGILADDMGLGKTMQVLTYLINEMYGNNQKINEVDKIQSEINNTIGNEEIEENNEQSLVFDCKLADKKENGMISLDMHKDISIEKDSKLTDKKENDFSLYYDNKNVNVKALILCPSSLICHWRDEISHYFDITASIYDSKRPKIIRPITICSYDSMRRDSYLEKQEWFMVILDEGHVLKNRSTILYSKVRNLKSNKKVILTGTPIHNSVEDLFSLFDIIMPGYLGTESEFLSLYNCKVTDKNFQVMEKRLSSLHKKTLPFIMRRLKSEVLKDLPPKIIKDVIVDLNENQDKLYQQYYNDDIQIKKTTEDEIDKVGYTSLKSYSLNKTKDLLKISSHPRHFTENVSSSKTSALIDIFNMCGGESIQNKILIFFQFKKTIDFVVQDLQSIYPNFQYLRLDGNVPAPQRGAIVSKFNTEPIPFLFLTTSIGGLGLNLTSADTVIFYEHDWNPFNDLQAMDRAHRLGQKNLVNVFRLIARNTIEEKVMNYQNFKLYVANSLITQQNNEIKTMDTKDILERFQGS